MFANDLRARLERARIVCRERGITQAQIAADLGASQPQVSRILGGEFSRAGRLAEEVCLYVERLTGGVTAEAVKSNDELINALATTWDGSGAHAKALSMVIKSLAALGARPARSGQAPNGK